MKPISLALCVLVASMLAACTTVPETGRSQLMMVSPDQEKQLGLSSFQDMKKEVPVSKDPQQNALVQKVGRKIASVANLPNADWEFVVFESKEANAFCLPGGKVGVYSGIFAVTRDEAGLATVIGHEVAHAVARHGAERISQNLLLQTGGELVGAGLAHTELSEGAKQAINLAYGVGGQVGVELPHSRKQELEADRIGLVYMARAGYDPQAALDFWKRFENFKSGSPSTPWFLSTHPVDSVRIQKIQELLPQAEAEYRKGGQTGGEPGRQRISR